MLGWVLKPLALASTLALSTLGLLGRKYQRARFIFHFTLYVSTLGAMSVWGVVVSLLATLAGQRFNINYYVARSFYHVCSPLVGIRLDVEGMEHLSSLATAREGKGQSAVLLGNHQSFLDILYLGRIFPKRAAIMAKRELQWSPLLGQYLTLSGAVMVDRKNRKNAVAALEKAGDDMKKKGLSLWIFPEGTRSSSPEPKLLPFKKGAFHLAVQAQVPIVPVVCENYHRLFDGRTRMERGRLRIKVLPPIPTVGLTADDVHSLAESTQELMLQTLISMSTPGPSQLRESPPTVEDHKASISAPPQDPVTGERQLRNREGNSSDGSSGGGGKAGETGSGGQLGSSVSAGSTTEDEMDEDVVLLKKPKAE